MDGVGARNLRLDPSRRDRVCIGYWFQQNGLTALLHACANGHLAIARWLVDEKGIDHCADKTNVSSVHVRSPSRRR